MAVLKNQVFGLSIDDYNKNKKNPLIQVASTAQNEALKTILWMQFRDVITLMPKREKNTGKNKRDYGYIVIGLCDNPNEKDKQIYGHIPVRTFSSLLYHAFSDNAIFYTPNPFYRGYQTEYVQDITGEEKAVVKSSRKKDDLRWMTSYVLDFDDVNEDYIEEIYEKCAALDLPLPNCINRTRAGFQAMWIFSEPVRATRRAVATYDRISNNLQAAFGNDAYAKSANNYYRIPKDIRFVQYREQLDFFSFIDWSKQYEKDNNVEVEEAVGNSLFTKFSDTMIKQRGIRNVLRGVVDGHRNKACFALATIFKVCGASRSEALDALIVWDMRNMDKQNRVPMPLGVRSVEAHINSVYNSKEEIDKLPLAVLYNAQKFGSVSESIRKKPAFIVIGSVAKKREDRERHHYEERLQDIIEWLSRHGRIAQGSQNELADMFNMPISTFKVLKKKMQENEDLGVKVDVEGRGRHACTRLILLIETEPDGSDTDNSKKDNRKIVYLYKERSDQSTEVCQKNKEGMSPKINGTHSYIVLGGMEEGWLSDSYP